MERVKKTVPRLPAFTCSHATCLQVHLKLMHLYIHPCGYVVLNYTAQTSIAVKSFGSTRDSRRRLYRLTTGCLVLRQVYYLACPMLDASQADPLSVASLGHRPSQYQARIHTILPPKPPTVVWPPHLEKSGSYDLDQDK
jgi:hypothetical protein